QRERATLNKNRGLKLESPFSEMSPAELLAHFRNKKPIAIFNPAPNASDFALNPSPLTHARGSHDIKEWRRDPRSGYLWPLDYHGDIKLLRSDGSDIRVLWELNRLGHLLTLDDAGEFLQQL